MCSFQEVRSARGERVRGPGAPGDQRWRFFAFLTAALRALSTSFFAWERALTTCGSFQNDQNQPEISL